MASDMTDGGLVYAGGMLFFLSIIELLILKDQSQNMMHATGRMRTLPQDCAVLSVKQSVDLSCKYRPR